MAGDLSRWLRGMAPTRIVCQPGERAYPAPAVRPWQTLAEVAEGAAEVWAYKGEELQGIWRAPPPAVVASAPAPSADLSALREFMQLQGQMFRDALSSQALVVKTLQASIQTLAAFPAPADEGEPEAEEEDANASIVERVMTDALSRGMANGPAPRAAK